MPPRDSAVGEGGAGQGGGGGTRGEEPGAIAGAGEEEGGEADDDAIAAAVAKEEDRQAADRSGGGGADGVPERPTFEAIPRRRARASGRVRDGMRRETGEGEEHAGGRAAPRSASTGADGGNCDARTEASYGNLRLEKMGQERSPPPSLAHTPRRVAPRVSPAPRRRLSSSELGGHVVQADADLHADEDDDDPLRACPTCDFAKSRGRTSPASGSG